MDGTTQEEAARRPGTALGECQTSSGGRDGDPPGSGPSQRARPWDGRRNEAQKWKQVL